LACNYRLAMADFSSRAGHQIPKPKDWQEFQRGCVVLFQAELADPNALEYGRNGQKQNGIDILGRRNGDRDHLVGVQCRLIEKPMLRSEMLDDCRAALKIKAGLKELIFATSCPRDAKATDAVVDVERQLRAEGHDLAVSLYSWTDLELKIACHPDAYDYFLPSPVVPHAAPTASRPASIDGQLRAITARNYFIPEITRIVIEQTKALERLTTNFSAASVKKPEHAGQQLLTLDQMALMKPPPFRLYPNAPQFADLAPDDAALLTEFYDALDGITSTIDRWILEALPMDVNAFNVMMQMVEENLARGEVLVERFCPDRLINAKYLSWGTVLARVQVIRSRTKEALHRHLARHNAL
jgi:hypothetical protein